jgi:hypothetical protein
MTGVVSKSETDIVRLQQSNPCCINLTNPPALIRGGGFLCRISESLLELRRNPMPTYVARGPELEIEIPQQNAGRRTIAVLARNDDLHGTLVKRRWKRRDAPNQTGGRCRQSPSPRSIRIPSLHHGSQGPRCYHCSAKKLDDLPEWDWYNISAHLKCTKCGSVGWVDTRERTFVREGARERSGTM